jgi:hypothetical protein
MSWRRLPIACARHSEPFSACMFLRWHFFGRSEIVSMPIPLRRGAYSSACSPQELPTSTNSTSEPFRGVMTPSTSIGRSSPPMVIALPLATGKTRPSAQVPSHLLVTDPRQGLRQRILVRVPHGVVTSEAALPYLSTAPRLLWNLPTACRWLSFVLLSF